jgi:FAD-linked sulfhydryl oxidase
MEEVHAKRKRPKKRGGGGGGGASALERPPTATEFGSAVWAALHSMAAYFPAAPSPAEQADAAEYLRLVADLHPCKPCGAHMREHMQRSPVATHSHAALALWLCDYHNRVNAARGKPLFDCAQVDKRWGGGDAE